MSLLCLAVCMLLLLCSLGLYTLMLQCSLGLYVDVTVQLGNLVTVKLSYASHQLNNKQGM